MNNESIYLERLKGSMKEKMFFINHLNLRNTTVVDIGCADGQMLKELKTIYGDDITLVGVEKNKNFYEKMEWIADYAFNTLEDLHYYLSKHTDSTIVFITSSVLHECSLFEQLKITFLASKYSDYWIIRDMYYEEKQKCFAGELLSKIMQTEITDRKQLAEFLSKQDVIDGKVIAEWLLKYPYKENWETENKEYYWNTSWETILTKNSKILYDNKYTNTFIQDRVLKDYNIPFNWAVTHRQMILQNMVKLTW